MEHETFGSLLRRYRRAAGLSQELLAERAGLSTAAVAALEQGVRRAPYRDTVRLLGLALGLAPEEHAALAAAVVRGRALPAPAAPEVRLPTLPTPPTPLIGRAREVAEVAALLRDGDARLVTLVGPGGVGKTRVALRVARDVGASSAPGGADGVAWVPLAALRDPDLVAPTIAHALNVPESTDRPVVEVLCAALHTRRLLLLLDNLEHLLPAAPLLAELLAACPLLRILTTSRAALRLRGEHVYTVPPLALPDPTQHPTPAALEDVPAVMLLVQRARDAEPGFVLNAANAAAIAALCHHLDGLPLALELAAARLSVLSPGMLAQRLSAQLSLLTDGARDLPARQRTLRATLDWSYDLLSAGERAVYRRLCVFAGGCTLEAAEAVCAADDDPPGAVLARVGALQEKSLLRRAAEGWDEPRFVMLETVREYGRERLDEAGDAAAVHALHARYYLGLAQQANAGPRAPETERARGRLKDERDNLRAVLQWAQESGADAAGRSVIGLRLATALWPLWLTWGQLGEGRGWLETALAQTLSGPATAPPDDLRARALHGAGVLATEQADYERATTLLEQSLALYEAVDDSEGMATVLNLSGVVAKYRSDLGRATAAYERSLALWRELDNTRNVARLLNNLGALAADQGDYARAIALYEESLALKRAAGTPHDIANGLVNLGEAVSRQGDHRRAAAILEESVALLRAMGDDRGGAIALLNLGIALGQTGAADQARARLRESLRLSWPARNAYLMAETLEALATLVGAPDDPEHAARLYGASAAVRQRIGAPLRPADRAGHDGRLAALRATLGEAAFQMAQAAGATLPLEHLITAELASDA